MASDDKPPNPIPDQVKQRITREVNLPALRTIGEKAQNEAKRAEPGGGGGSASGDARQSMRTKHIRENQRHTVTPGTPAPSSKGLIDRFGPKGKGPSSGKGKGKDPGRGR